MSISRQSITGPTSGSVAATTFTDVAYNPGYGGTEKCRMVVVLIWNSGASSGAIATIDGGGITYGGVPMHVATGAFVGNAVGAHGIWFIINPPTGAQDIVYTSIGGNIGGVSRAIVALESDTDTGMRISRADNVTTLSATTSSVLFTTTSTAGFMLGQSKASFNQTVTAGTPIGGDGTLFAIVDSNGEVTTGTSTGITVTTGTSGTIFQVAIVVTPIRRAGFWFFE